MMSTHAQAGISTSSSIPGVTSSGRRVTPTGPCSNLNAVRLRPFPCRRASTLAARSLLLGRRPALLGAAARARLLAAVARRLRRVGDARSALLRHALVLQGLVLLLVLDARSFVRHVSPFRLDGRFPECASLNRIVAHAARRAGARWLERPLTGRA